MHVGALRALTPWSPIISYENEGTSDVSGGTPGADGQGEGGGSPKPDDGQTSKPFDGVSDAETKDWLTRSGIADVNALATKARELDRFTGKAVQVPDADASKEDWDKFYTKLGRPEAADKYEFQVPDSLPDNLPYDEESAKAFKGVAHELGLTPAQASKIHDWYVAAQVSAISGLTEQSEEKLEERRKSTSEALTKVWGPLDGKTAKANAEFADKALEIAGDPGVINELQEAGLLGPNKEPLAPKFGILMARLGAALFKEDDVVHGHTAAVGNPFADGTSFNMTKAMELYRKDPEHAKTLMYAAGKSPKDFGITA